MWKIEVHKFLDFQNRHFAPVSRKLARMTLLRLLELITLPVTSRDLYYFQRRMIFLSETLEENTLRHY